MISGGLGVASAVAGAAGGGKDGESSGQLAVYDPFAEARQGYVKQLGKFVRNPAKRLEKLPAYQQRMAAGRRAVESSGAARGLLDSGALGVELMQQGQTFAAEEYDKEFQRLARLAGVDIAPNVQGVPAGQQSPGWGSVLGEVSELPWGQITGGGSNTQPVVSPPSSGYSGGATPTTDMFGSYSWT